MIKAALRSSPFSSSLRTLLSLQPLFPNTPQSSHPPSLSCCLCVCLHLTCPWTHYSVLTKRNATCTNSCSSPLHCWASSSSSFFPFIQSPHLILPPSFSHPLTCSLKNLLFPVFFLLFLLLLGLSVSVNAPLAPLLFPTTTPLHFPPFKYLIWTFIVYQIL